MKGIGHFLTGVAVATCFPEAMRATLNDNSLIILMGGAFGLLPDTLDFRMCRYLWKHDYTHTPDLDNLDAQPIADMVAKAIDEAHDDNKTVRVKLHTLKVSANFHQTYSIKIDQEKKVVHAEIGPLMTMGQVMGGGGHLPNSVPTGEEGHGKMVAEAPYKADMNNPYHARTTVGIFSGPDFSFVPDDGQVRMDFIPWHRTWAHSPFVGILCGLLGWLIYSLFGVSELGAAAFTTPLALTAFGVGTLAFWGHTFVDQFGILGSVLFWPFSDKRSSGFKWTHAASVLGNITLNYCCIAIIMWNLIVYTDEAAVVLPWAANMTGGYSDLAFYFTSLANYLAYYVAIPIATLHLGSRLYRKFLPAVTYPEVDYSDSSSSDEVREIDEEGLDGPGEMGTI